MKGGKENHQIHKFNVSSGRNGREEIRCTSPEMCFREMKVDEACYLAFRRLKAKIRSANCNYTCGHRDRLAKQCNGCQKSDRTRSALELSELFSSLQQRKFLLVVDRWCNLAFNLWAYLLSSQLCCSLFKCTFLIVSGPLRERNR